MSIFDKVSGHISVETDSDFDVLFTGLAKEGSYKDPESFKKHINYTFNSNEKVANKLEEWFSKLALDRNKLMELFGK